MDNIKYKEQKAKGAVLSLRKVVGFGNLEADSVVKVDVFALSVEVTNGTCEAPSSIAENEEIELTIVPNEHYLIPTAVTVTGATAVYDALTGKLTLSKPTGAVSVVAICLGEEYTITATITNGTATGDATIRRGSTANLTIVPNANCSLPETISVTGAQYSYNDETGAVVLSSATGNVTLTAECTINATILGVENEGIESGTLTRTDDAVGKSFSINSSTGIISSDFDSVFPYSQITEVTDDKGNVFVRIPKHYVKYTYSESTHYLKTQISNVKGEGYILNPCFKNEAGQEMDYVCVGKYDACKVTDNGTDYARSKTGEAPITSTNHSNCRTYCKANGANYGMLDYWTWRMLQDLFKIEFATTNCQSVMRGNVSGSAQNSGQCDSISDGKSGWNLTNNCMVYRGIENLWGNVSIWIDGITFNNHNIYVCYDPTAYASGSTASPYQLVGYQINPNGGGNSSQRGFDSNHPIVWESVETNGGDYATGGYWFDSTTDGSGTNVCAYIYGTYYNANYCGLWNIESATAGTWQGNYCTRLIYRGDPSPVL